ncbi:MAG: sigma-70 family RNA polymerase sigma factor [Planctomycetota bacterium]
MNPAPDDSKVERLWHELHSQVRSKVQDEHQADDVVQESWLRTIETRLPRIDKLPAWLRVVARHLIIEGSRSRRRRLERERAVARPDVSPPVDAGVHPGENVVLRLVAELPEPYQRVVRLRYLEDCTVAEIARREGRAEATVRSQLKRGLDRLRVRLQVQPTRNGRGRKRTSAFAWWSRRSSKPAASPASAWIAACVLGALVGGLTWIAIADDARVDGTSALDSVARAADETLAPGIVLSDDIERPLHGERLVAPVSMPFGIGAARAEAASLRGRVVLRPDGSRIRGARVRGAASIDDHTGIELGVTDDEGRFDVAPHELPLWLWAEHDGYSATARVQVDAVFRASGRELLLRSAHAGRVEGDVVDEANRTIAGAHIVAGEAWDVEPVRAAQLLYEAVPPPQFVRSDAAGRFAVPIPANGWLRVSAEGFAPRSVNVDAGSEIVRIVLARLDEASARTAGGSSSLSLPHATARWSGSFAASTPQIDLRRKRAGAETWTSIAIDADGRFASGPLAAGEHELVVSSADSHGAWLVQRARLRDGEHFESHGIELPALGAVLVRVRTPPNADVQGPANVVLRGIATATTVHHNDLGNAVRIDRAAKTVELARIWPGSYEIVLRGAGLREAVVPLEVRAGVQNEIDVEMESGFTVFVRVNAARALTDGEQLEAFFDTPRGNVPVARLNATHPASLEPLTTFNAGAPHDARRLVVRTSGGQASADMYAVLDLAPLAQRQGSRITLSLR